MQSTLTPQPLARYATICQEANIVPIVEPEVLMDGGHTLERCEEVTNVVLDRIFTHLFAARVYLEGMILKPNMVIAGKKCAQRGVAGTGGGGYRADLEAPGAVRGARDPLFLSGGQSPTEATLHLSLMNANGALPWGPDLQLWPRSAGVRSQCLGREVDGLCGRAASAGGACKDEQSRCRRDVQAFDGKVRGVN